MTKLFKEKRIILSLFLIFAASLVFVLFHQFLVSHDERFIPRNTMFLSGWADASNDKGISLSNNSVSTFAFHVREKNNYKLNFEMFTKGSEQGFDIYLNNTKIKGLRFNRSGSWLKVGLLLPMRLIKSGYNSITFFSTTKEFSAIEYKNIVISIFSVAPINILSGTVILTLMLVIFWLIYSIWLAAVAEVDYSRSLFIDSFSYIGSIFGCLLIYIIINVMHRYDLSAEINFVFLSVLMACFLKFIAFFKFIGLTSKSINYYSLSAIFVLISFCSLVLGKNKFSSEWLANFVYFLLIFLGMVRLVKINENIL